jgi:predicted subunit of tRNA(5-methylaminomethyl-2-thiouridylate) methyltransferase
MSSKPKAPPPAGELAALKIRKLTATVMALEQTVARLADQVIHRSEFDECVAEYLDIVADEARRRMPDPDHCRILSDRVQSQLESNPFRP